MNERGTKKHMLAVVSLGVAILIGGVLPNTAVAQVGANADILNPNLASADQLMALPHLNDATAKAIEDGRPWLTMGALDAALAEHLNAEQRSELYAKLFLPLNLNEAGDAEIKLIPGVGDRMARPRIDGVREVLAALLVEISIIP